MKSPMAIKKRAPARVKEYGPHEHFGSPDNICRTCGQTYSYTPKYRFPFAPSKG